MGQQLVQSVSIFKCSLAIRLVKKNPFGTSSAPPSPGRASGQSWDQGTVMPVWSQDFVSWKTLLLAHRLKGIISGFMATGIVQEPWRHQSSLAHCLGQCSDEEVGMTVRHYPCSGCRHQMSVVDDSTPSKAHHIPVWAGGQRGLVVTATQLSAPGAVVFTHYLYCSYYKLLWVCNAISSPSITLQNFTDGELSRASPQRTVQSICFPPPAAASLLGKRAGCTTCCTSRSCHLCRETGILPLAAPAAATQAQKRGEGLVPAASTALTEVILPHGISRFPHGDLSFSKQPGSHKHDAVSNQVKASPLLYQNSQ